MFLLGFKKYLCSAWAIIVFILLLSFQNSAAQISTCDSLKQLGLFVEQKDSDTLSFNFVDPNLFGKDIVIRVDKGPEQMSADFLCVTIERSGFYQFIATILYTDDRDLPLERQQNNESFFLQVSSSRGPCNPNLDKEKVVVPDLPEENELISDQKAGIFFLTKGTFVIRIVHYFTIHALPGNDIFVRPPGFNPAKIPESVHLRKLVMKKIANCTPSTNAYDLSLNKSVSQLNAEPGDVFKYSLQIRNKGPRSAANFSLTDILPDSISPVEFLLNPPIDAAARPLKWNFAAIAPEEAIDIEFTATFPQEFDIAVDSLKQVNTAFIQAAQDTNASNDTASAVVYIKSPPDTVAVYDLKLTKNATPQSVKAGEIITYSFKINNLGPDRSENIRLSDLLPDSISAIEFLTEPQPINPTAQLLEWELAPLDSGDTTDIEFTATFDQELQIEGDSLKQVNTAFINALHDINASNDTASAAVYIKPPPDSRAVYDLQLSKSVNPRSIKPGEIITYSFEIRNLGPESSENVRLTDLLPDSINAIEFLTDPQPINPTAQLLQWELTPLDSGDTKEIRFTATYPKTFEVPADSISRLNTGYLTTAMDTNAVNDTSSAIVFILQEPAESIYDLALTKSVSSEQVEQGKEFTYTLNIVNNGPSTAERFTVLDAIPTGVRVSSFSILPLDPFAADTLRWQIENPLAAGESLQIRYNGLCPLVPGSQDTLTKINVASVISANDLLSHNNSDTAMVICVPPLQTCQELVFLDRSVFEPSNQDNPLEIMVNVGTLTDITLGIFDITGYPIKNISTANATVGLNTFFWDGKTTDGMNAGSGVYIIVARDRQSNGRTLECIQKVLIVR